MAAALESIGQTDLPPSTVRHWLAEAGIAHTGRSGRPPALSVAQISSALHAVKEYTQENGNSFGSIRAAYDRLGLNGSVSHDGFKQYFTQGDLSPYGRTMLEQSRRAESGAARGDGSGRSA